MLRRDDGAEDGADDGADDGGGGGGGDGGDGGAGFTFVLGSPRELSKYRIASKEDKYSTTIKWSNCSIMTMQVYWINYNGDLCPRMKLEPGESYVESSWSTHPWYVQPCMSGSGGGGGGGGGGGRTTRKITTTSESKSEPNKEGTKEGTKEEDVMRDASTPVNTNGQGCLVILSGT